MLWTAAWIAISILVIPLAIAGYIFFNVLFVSWISRNLGGLFRGLSIFLLNQFKVLSTARIWTTFILHFTAIIAFPIALSSSIEVFWLPLAIFGYVFFVSALTLSLLAQLPYLRALWSDVFFKIAATVIPIFTLYLAKGYAAL